MRAKLHSVAHAGLRDHQGGCVTTSKVTKVRRSRTCLEHTARAGESPVGDTSAPFGWDLKYDGTRDIPSEAGPTTVQGSISVTTYSAQYREGTVKSTLAKGVK